MEAKWYEGGAMADNRIIYCVPFDSNHGILKIDMKTDTPAKERNRKECLGWIGAIGWSLGSMVALT